MLRERIFTPLDAEVPLHYRRGSDEGRARILLEPRTNWVAVNRDLVWGEPDGYFWFAGTAVLPPEAAGRRVFCRVLAQFGSVMGRSDPQCLVRIDGRIAQGVDGNHREFLLTEAALSGERFEIVIEAGTIEDRRQLGFGCQLLIHDPLAEKLYFDLKVPLEVARLLKPDDARRTRILAHIRGALTAIDLRPGDAQRFADSLVAAEHLADRIYADADADAMPAIVATGHTHIDVAWLWRVRETRQKTARSFATALALMDQYPDYRFIYNQGVLLDYLEQDYPALFERMRQKIGAGQFEIEGALWLEPDVTIAAGEALVRHILHGVRYHQRKFGVTPRIVWLPDTFGYSAALPQLMALAGLDMFVTHKLSWNDTNRMPYEVFHWQGIDGTKVPSYFLTTQKYEYDGINTTYCPDLVPSHVLGTWKRFSQKGSLDELFLVYGHGDGGGGPTRAMLENVRRMERGIPGCPRIKHEPMGPFFHRLADRFRDDPDAFPTWVGELYLEYHRGTLTSVARNKRNNRLAETALRELETLAVLAMSHGVAYPAEQLWELWQIVLLNQFHDILPGSSIGAVYEDSDRDYAGFFAKAERLGRSLAAPLAASGRHFLLNVLARERGGLVSLPPGAMALIEDGAVVAAQQIVRADGTTENVAPASGVPSLGGKSVTFIAEPTPLPVNRDLSVSPAHLENSLVRVDLDSHGRIVSLLDKRCRRQAIEPGKAANALLAFRDIPVDFDAWDIDASYEDKGWAIDQLVATEVVETGPYRAALRLQWRYETSTITQVVSLERDSPRVELDCFVDWHEHQTLLKVAFPFAIRTDSITAEIQFGEVTRPTHRNTSWEQARFETSMHRWVDLSEPDFGVALINDCKYGYDAKGSTVRLTLIKSPVFPWPDADQGEHRFSYAILPHAGDRNVVRHEAEAFNLPLRAFAGASTRVPEDVSFVNVTEGSVCIDCIKRAEDGSGVVLRLWEPTGQHQSIVLTFSRRWARIVLTDLLERPQRQIAADTASVRLELGPFKIVTLRLDA